MTHADLCGLAVRWLRRPWSAGGHGCQVSVSECRADYSGEVPDAIGFRSGWAAGSVVVECKTSRSDFFADRAKPHRQPGAGMGTWRYFMAPAALLRVDEMPAGWGLIEVGDRNRIVVLHGAARETRNHTTLNAALDAFKNSSDADRERDLLVRLLARLGDAEKLNGRIRDALGSVMRLARENEKLRKDLDKARWDLYELRKEAA